MDDCLVCGNEKEVKTPSGVFDRSVCKMCGMIFNKGIHYSGLSFCSDKCRKFFIQISEKSPDMAKRDIVI